MRTLSIIIVMCWATALVAQVPDITRIEYFFNTDPGVGNATEIPVTAGNLANVTVTVSTSGLAPGQHRLYVRARDAEGTWSVSVGRSFIVEAVNEPVIAGLAELNRVEFFINTDPGFGLGTSLPTPENSVVSLSESVIAPGLNPGTHRLHVRARDESGQWSAVLTRSFFVEAMQEPIIAIAPKIDAFEYFFGDDPGLGNGILLANTPTDVLELDELISSTGLNVGNKTLYFRARNTDGLWSPVLMREFAIIDVLNAISALTPANNSTINSIFPSLKWSSLPEATGYELQVDINAAFDSDSLFAEVLEDTTITLGPLEYLTTYHWRVRPVDGTFNGPWTATRSFTTGFYNPDVPVLLAPADDATGVPLSATLAWQLSARADSYDIEVASDVGFEQLIYPAPGKRLSGDNTPEYLSTSGVYGSLQLTGLDHGTRYFWRVRGTNEYGNGDWSETRHFTTLTVGIASVTLLSPASGSEDVPLPITLTWQTVTGASHYGVEVSTNPAFTNRMVYDSLSVASQGLVSLSDTTTYFWRVWAYAVDRDPSVSAVWEFRTELRLPETPIWEPADMSVDMDSTVVLKWSPVIRADRYDIQLGTDLLFEVDPSLYEGVTKTELELNGLQWDSQYYWRVRGVNDRGAGGWSEPLRFHTTVSIEADISDVPTDASLSQNYPNPFNPSTAIGYIMAESGHVRLAVYDQLGRSVAILVDGVMPAGTHSVMFDASGLSSGMYLYRYETAQMVITRKMMLVK